MKVQHHPSNEGVCLAAISEDDVRSKGRSKVCVHYIATGEL